MLYHIYAILTAVFIGVGSHFLSKYNNDKENEKSTKDLVIGIIFSILSLISFVLLAKKANQVIEHINRAQFIKLYGLIPINFGILVFLFVCIALVPHFNIKQKRDGKTTPLILSSVVLSILIISVVYSFYNIEKQKKSLLDDIKLEQSKPSKIYTINDIEDD